MTKQAFDEKMSGEIGTTPNPTLKMLLEVAVKTYNEYDFIVAPNVPNFDSLSKEYETDLKAAMESGRKQVTDGGDAETIGVTLLEDFDR